MGHYYSLTSLRRLMRYRERWCRGKIQDLTQGYDDIHTPLKIFLSRKPLHSYVVTTSGYKLPNHQRDHKSLLVIVGDNR